MYTAPMLLSATRQQLHPTEHRLNTSVVVKLGERGRKCKKVSTIVKDVTIFTHDYVIRLTPSPSPFRSCYQRNNRTFPIDYVNTNAVTENTA